MNASNCEFYFRHAYQSHPERITQCHASHAISVYMMQRLNSWLNVIHDDIIINIGILHHPYSKILVKTLHSNAKKRIKPKQPSINQRPINKERGHTLRPTGQPSVSQRLSSGGRQQPSQLGCQSKTNKESKEWSQQDAQVNTAKCQPQRWSPRQLGINQRLIKKGRTGASRMPPKGKAAKLTIVCNDTCLLQFVIISLIPSPLQ